MVVSYLALWVFLSGFLWLDQIRVIKVQLCNVVMNFKIFRVFTTLMIGNAVCRFAEWLFAFSMHVFMLIIIVFFHLWDLLRYCCSSLVKLDILLFFLILETLLSSRRYFDDGSQLHLLFYMCKTLLPQNFVVYSQVFVEGVTSFNYVDGLFHQLLVLSNIILFLNCSLENLKLGRC